MYLKRKILIMETNKKSRKSRKKNITSEEVVERHLHDRSDVITTEDIQNVKVPPQDEPEIIEILPEEDLSSEDINPEEKKDHITPWNLIDP
jgi:hypothetical protein